jgi:hypothetical protein
MTQTLRTPTMQEQQAATQRCTDQQACNARHIQELERQEAERKTTGLRINRSTGCILHEVAD